MPTDAATAERLAALHDDGCVLLPGVLDAGRCAEVRAAIDVLTPIGLDYQGLVDDHYTCVIPGSHHAGRAPRPGELAWHGRSAEPVLCRAGDVLVFRSDLWHAGSRNRSAERSRYLLQIHYGRRMVAQKFSPYLEFTFDPVVLAAATPRQRRLLGEHRPAEYD